MSVKQWLTNFIGWVNDTMNMPAVAIWQVWEWLSPKWSKAEAAFRDFKNTAKWVTDIWQDYQSAWYVAGRLAPWAAVFWALPAAWVLPATAVAWVETAWLWALSTIPELEHNVKNGWQATRWWYRKRVKMEKAEPIKVEQKQVMPRAVYKWNISL